MRSTTKKQNYSFGEECTWDWRSFVAGMGNEQRDKLFEGHRIIAVAVERRVGCPDHNMCVAAKTFGWIDSCWELVDFAFCRGDGRTVLVHPDWKKKGCGFKRLMKLVEPSEPVPIIPAKGKGMSDGKGTHKRIMTAAYSAAAFSPVGAASSNSAVAGSSASAAAAPTGDHSATATGCAAAAAANAASSSAVAAATAADLWK